MKINHQKSEKSKSQLYLYIERKNNKLKKQKL